MATTTRHSDMGSTYEWKRWLRVNGFDRPHPHPGPDLGYDGRELKQRRMGDVDSDRFGSDEFDHWWQDPLEYDAWVLAPDALVVDLEAWA